MPWAFPWQDRRRVVESFFPETVFYEDAVGREQVTQLALKFSNVGVVLGPLRGGQWAEGSCEK